MATCNPLPQTKWRELRINKRKRVEREVSSTENTKAPVFETEPALVYTRGHLYMHTHLISHSLSKSMSTCFYFEIQRGSRYEEHHLLQYLLPMYNLPSAVPQY